MPSSRLKALIEDMSEDAKETVKVEKTTKKSASSTSKSKTSAKKATRETKSKTTKKTTTKKDTTKKTVAKKTTTKKATVKKNTVKNSTKIKPFVDIPEYYDLPYRYNQTVVKVLYQNPTTLFVYWDISDSDILYFKEKYGENFFYITKPVLVVHNLTDNYSFEVDINDFANNWYITVNDAKCKYSVELARKPSQSDKIKDIKNNTDTSFVDISFSNTIEIPNDHVLFFKDKQKIYFKNIKTNSVIEKTYNKNLDDKDVRDLYNNYNLSQEDDRFDLKNPSSQNPTSNVM